MEGAWQDDDVLLTSLWRGAPGSISMCWGGGRALGLCHDPAARVGLLFPAKLRKSTGHSRLLEEEEEGRDSWLDQSRGARVGCAELIPA